MTRHCRITDCPTPTAKRRNVCHRHYNRIRRYGDPHFTTWTVADEHDVQTVIQQQQPAPGLTRLERILVARGLTQRDVPAEEIARILDVTPRTVYRWRADSFRQAA